MMDQDRDQSCERKTKTKANDRSRRGLPRVFAKSERGLDAATAAETDMSAVTGFGDDRINRKGSRGRVGRLTVLNKP